MCSILLFVNIKRWAATNKKVVPIRTCNPWNPVAIKNVEPKAESAKEKVASWYSNPCSMENKIPKVTVTTKAFNLVILSDNKNAWWHQVIDTPEERSNNVFNKGILMGLKGIIIWGGQIWPNSKLGEILLWKKAQKKEAKNKTSETINNNIPACKPTVTCKLWLPWAILSAKTSRHQQKAVTKIIGNANKSEVLTFAFIQRIIESIKAKAPMEAIKGQGLFFY